MDKNALFALILSVLAGLSTMIGALIIFFTKAGNKRILSISLGFAAGIMISVSFEELFPSASGLLKSYTGEKAGVVFSVLFLALGILLAFLIDKLVPHEEFDENTGEKSHKDLFRVGFVSMLAIALHNFPEGIATFMAGYRDLSLGISIAVAIALHNIPEGVSVAMPIYFASKSKSKALKYTFFSGIAEPIGAILAFAILRPFINDFILGAMFSLVSGIMIYIAIEELIPSSRQYGYDRDALLATFSGIILMPLTSIF